MTVLRLGILFSTSGDYAAMGRDCRDGAMLAIEELQGRDGFTIEPTVGDPGGSAAGYMDLARTMLATEGCRHILGTVTSQARKDVIPVVEKYDGQLWYVCPYEGFEANPSVIYTGACPNQHLVPLFAHLLPIYGGRVYLAGANYVWGWEMNRLARELVTQAGGEIVGERCLPIGETDVGRITSEIAERRPDFVLSNLIGPSSYAFLRAMHSLGQQSGFFRPESCPVVSCDLTECELGEIGFGVADGQLATAAYFDSAEGPENAALKARVAARFGAERRLSSFFATSYATVHLWFDAISRIGTDDPALVRASLARITTDSPIGPLAIDPATNHAALPFLLGKIAGDRFEIIQSRPRLAADPYLTARQPSRPAVSQRPHLRVVS